MLRLKKVFLRTFNIFFVFKKSQIHFKLRLENLCKLVISITVLGLQNTPWSINEMKLSWGIVSQIYTWCYCKYTAKFSAWHDIFNKILINAMTGIRQYNCTVLYTRLQINQYITDYYIILSSQEWSPHYDHMDMSYDKLLFLCYEQYKYT
jgi:hypothetical protein